MALLSARAPAAGFGPQPNTQLIQVIDTEEKEDHADITVQFGCTVHYITNLPLNHGSRTRITLRLGPDCGSFLGGFPPEMPVVGGGGHLVTNAEVESTVPGEVVLELTLVTGPRFRDGPHGQRPGAARAADRNRPPQGERVRIGAAGSGGLCGQPRVLIDELRSRGRADGRLASRHAGVCLRDRHRGRALVPAAGGSVRHPAGGRARPEIALRTTRARGSRCTTSPRI